MTEPKFREGHEFRDDDGNLICRAACDIFAGDIIQQSQFKDWQVPEPVVGEPLPPAIAKAILQ